MKYAIIGAGPTGLAAALAAVSQNIEFDLIDPWDVVSRDDAGSTTVVEKKNIAKKSNFGSFSMYDYPIDLLSRDMHINLPLSLTVGGLSTVWGANIWLDEASDLGIDDRQAFLNSQSSLIQTIPMTTSSNSQNLTPTTTRISRSLRASSNVGSNDVFQRSQLAIDIAKCTKCGLCLTGCPEDAIFSADLYWNKLSANPLMKIRKGVATSLQLTDSKQIAVEVILEKTSTNYIYDYIFIACGAIASSALLQRSNLYPKEVVIDDTQVFYLPLFSLFPASSKDSSFTLAQAYFRAQGLRSFHMSVYEVSKDINARISRKYPIISRFIPNFIWSRMLAGIAFIPAEKSGKLKMDYHDSKPILTSKPNMRSRMYFQLSILVNIKYFFRARLIPISFVFQKPNVGASYHVGATKSHGIPLLDQEGRLDKIIPISVVDSSSLPLLPTGPITFAAMVNAHRIVSKILHEKEKQ
jgi:ferredoxin